MKSKDKKIEGNKEKERRGKEEETKTQNFTMEYGKNDKYKEKGEKSGRKK